MLLYWLNNRGLRAWWKQFCLCECWSQKSNMNALALASLEDLVEQKQHSDIINNCLLWDKCVCDFCALMWVYIYIYIYIYTHIHLSVDMVLNTPHRLLHMHAHMCAAACNSSCFWSWGQTQLKTRLHCNLIMNPRQWHVLIWVPPLQPCPKSNPVHLKDGTNAAAQETTLRRNSRYLPPDSSQGSCR